VSLDDVKQETLEVLCDVTVHLWRLSPVRQLQVPRHGHEQTCPARPVWVVWRNLGGGVDRKRTHDGLLEIRLLEVHRWLWLWRLLLLSLMLLQLLLFLLLLWLWMWLLLLWLLLLRLLLQVGFQI